METPKEVKYYTENKAPESLNNILSPFFYQTEINALNWNQSYPYQLMILVSKVKYVKDKEIVDRALDAGRYPLVSSSDRAEYVKTPYVFTLPIPPQELGINMPIATTVSATLDGIVEQHGGAPFRDIIIQGTTGITPIKNNVSAAIDGSPELFRTIFAGTTRAVGVAETSITSIVKPNTHSAILNDGISDPKSPENSINNNLIPGTSTGYYQIRLLQKFIESYVELKKKSIDWEEGNTRDLRLALAIWKDESVYLCSGVQFNLKRSATNPMEYMYTLQLKAWKRINPQSSFVGALAYKPVSRQPNGLVNVLNRMRAVTDLIDSVGDIVASTIEDPKNRIKEIARETTLWAKATVGAAETISDMPKNLQKDILDIVRQEKVWYGTIKKIYPDLELPSQFQSGLNKVTVGKKSAISAKNSASKKNAPAQTQQPLSSPSDIKTILKRINLKTLPLPKDTLNKVLLEKERVKEFDRKYFEERRDLLEQFILDLTDQLGGGGIVLNQTLNRPTNLTTAELTDDQLDLLFALNEMLISLNELCASSTINPPTLSSVEYVAGLAQKSGIAFRVPLSKYAVPYPYGHTLEQVAKIYLGDPQRWHEIATLNGLRAPYIDEEGFSLSFLVNGDGNKLYVSSKDNLFINQTIFISSLSKKRSKRRITNIREFYAGFVEITVDGDSDLDDYLVSAQARLEAFLPGTVNSQQIIYIPSDQSVAEDPRTKSIPGIDEFDPLLKVGGIDLLLTSDGDLAITNDGDCRLAYGLQNIVQSVKLALTTPQGTLIAHPEFGIPLEVGLSTADVSATDVAKSVARMFEGDPAFTGVSSVQVVKDGPVISLIVVLGIKGVSDNVPITINLVR